MSSGPTVRAAVREDAAEIARLLAPQGFDVAEESVSQVWDGWEGEGNFAMVVEGDVGLLGVVTAHVMTVLHRPTWVKHDGGGPRRAVPEGFLLRIDA